VDLIWQLVLKTAEYYTRVLSNFPQDSVSGHEDWSALCGQRSTKTDMTVTAPLAMGVRPQGWVRQVDRFTNQRHLRSSAICFKSMFRCSLKKLSSNFSLADGLWLGYARAYMDRTDMGEGFCE
jgi:hypothetical protein